MNNPDEQDSLWRLLGKARPSAASPFFARNVVREARALRQEQTGFFAALLRHWQVTLASAAAACIIAAASFQFLGHDLVGGQADSLSIIAQQVSDSPDYYVINDLDDLLASEESSVWLEN